MSNNAIFGYSEADTQVLKLLKEELFSAEKSYKRLLKLHSSEETIVCTFNHLRIVKQFDNVCELKKAILKLSNHDGKFIEI